MMGLGPLVETKRLEIQICDLEAKIARLTRERDELSSEVTDLHMVAQSIKHYWQCDPAAGIPCVRCQRDEWRARAEKAERLLAADALTREAQGLGLYDQTAGGARLPAESPADYPDGSFSPSGISFADLPDDARPPDFLRPGFGTGNVTVKTEAEEAGP